MTQGPTNKKECSDSGRKTVGSASCAKSDEILNKLSFRFAGPDQHDQSNDPLEAFAEWAVDYWLESREEDVA